VPSCKRLLSDNTQRDDGPIAKKLTMDELADHLGVHPSTVSRSLDPGRSHLVAPGTRARVRDAARDLGYRLNPTAAGLRRGRTMTVGILTPDLGNITIIEAIRALSDVLDQQDLTPLIAESMDDPARSEHLVERFLARSIDAIVSLAATEDDREVLTTTAKDVPVVLAVRVLKDSGLPTVRCDDRLGASLAAGHLADLGHVRVGHVQGPQRSQLFADRAIGFAETAAMRGIKIQRGRYVADHATAFEGRRLASALLDSSTGQSPTAIFAHNDALAVGVYSALQDRGLRCPEDVSIVGFNAASFPLATSIEFTSVSYPSREIGARAGEIVIDLLAGRKPTTTIEVYPPRLVVRASSAAPAS
jgi:DNA-binding LacI/PurR family transcriptional regulator